MASAKKGIGEAPTYTPDQTRNLRIGIVHSRWNSAIITSLVSGCTQTLSRLGIPSANVVVQSIPGSYELPYAVHRMWSAGQMQRSSAADPSGTSAGADLLDMASGGGEGVTSSSAKEEDTSSGPLDVIIAIGVLIKGSTMHFEYISDAVSHGLMKLQLDSGCPVIFGVLTCLNEDQACERAGIESKLGKGHNHGEDWGEAAVEMAIKRRGWTEGKFL